MILKIQVSDLHTVGFTGMGGLYDEPSAAHHTQS